MLNNKYNCAFQSHHNSEQARKAEEKIRKCEKQEQATEADMKEFFEQKKPSTRAGKCLHACLMESIGLVMQCFWTFFDQSSLKCDYFFCLFRSTMECFQWKTRFVLWLKWPKEIKKLLKSSKKCQKTVKIFEIQIGIQRIIEFFKLKFSSINIFCFAVVNWRSKS